MWRLLYAMIVVSDGGSIAIDSGHTDWPSQHACDYAARTLYTTPPTSVVNGIKLTIKTNVQCVPFDLDAPAPPPAGARYYAPPPPPPGPPGFPAITFGPRGVRLGY